MSEGTAAIRSIAKVLVVWALGWLLLNVNAHSDRITQKATSALVQLQAHVRSASVPRSVNEGGGGLHLIEMFECMCQPLGSGGGGWVGLWLVTALIGGVPTAVLLRHHR